MTAEEFLDKMEWEGGPYVYLMYHSSPSPEELDAIRPGLGEAVSKFIQASAALNTILDELEDQL